MGAGTSASSGWSLISLKVPSASLRMPTKSAASNWESRRSRLRQSERLGNSSLGPQDVPIIVDITVDHLLNRESRLGPGPAGGGDAPARPYPLGGGAAIKRDHRGAAGHGLEHYQPERFVPLDREEKAVRPAHQFPLPRLGDFPEKRYLPVVDMGLDPAGQEITGGRGALASQDKDPVQP